MKARNLAFALAFCVCVVMPIKAGAQIRDYVGIVRSTLRPESSAYLEKLRDTLRSDGYANLPDVIDGYLKGGFGSGFVYVAGDGRNYVITNRHVVSEANNASIEFQHRDGTADTYKDLTVLAIDEDIDIALLAFPDGVRPFKKGLQIDLAERDDGEEIWSAGFPGLNGNPVWQLGKGTITNANARIAELADIDKTALIQHSAQVDPGNSGGPLLVASRESTGGYRVIGINTWKALNRQATNYSLPSKTVISFVNRALSRSTADDPRSTVQDRAGAFAGFIETKKPAYQAIVKYIAYDFVYDSGSESIRYVLGKAPTKVRDDIMSVFTGLSPIEGMRYAIAYRLERDLTGDDGTPRASVGQISPVSDGRYSAEIASGDTAWTCAWMTEQGLWRIRSFAEKVDETVTNDKKKVSRAKRDEGTKEGSPLTFNSPYSSLILASYGVDPSGASGYTFIGHLLLSQHRNFAYGIAGMRTVADCDRTATFASVTETVSVTMVGALFEVRIQAPFVYPNFSVTPFLQGGGAIGVMTFSPDFSHATGYTLEGGVLCGIGSAQRFFAQCSYLYKNIKESSLGDGGGARMDNGAIMLSVGLGL